MLSDPDARVEPQKLLDALRQATCRVFGGLSSIARRQTSFQELSIEMQMYTVGGRHWWGCSQEGTGWPKAARSAARRFPPSLLVVEARLVPSARCFDDVKPSSKTLVPALRPAGNSEPPLARPCDRTSGSHKQMLASISVAP